MTKYQVGEQLEHKVMGTVFTIKSVTEFESGQVGYELVTDAADVPDFVQPLRRFEKEVDWDFERVQQ